MLGHDDVAYNYKMMAPTHLLHDFEEKITVARTAKRRSALVATGGDEVEVSGDGD
jgi:hypothetical protein